jgi:EAL domain-containing protein (putative c-di-GMP-specific phosphodiesterase class I)
MARVRQSTLAENDAAALFALGSSMGLLVTAEGVECRTQAALLASMGCKMVQGPLFGGALSGQQIGGYPSDDLGSWAAVSTS